MLLVPEPNRVETEKAQGHKEFLAPEQESSKFNYAPGSPEDRVKMQIPGLHPQRFLKNLLLKRMWTSVPQKRESRILDVFPLF